MLSIYLFFSLTFPFLSITYASQKIKHIVLKVKRKFPHMTRTYDDVLSILIALENSQKCLKALYCKDWSRFYQSEEGKNKNNPPTFHPSRQVDGAQRLINNLRNQTLMRVVLKLKLRLDITYKM